MLFGLTSVTEHVGMVRVGRPGEIRVCMGVVIWVILALVIPNSMNNVEVNVLKCNLFVHIFF